MSKKKINKVPNIKIQINSMFGLINMFHGLDATQYPLPPNQSIQPQHIVNIVSKIIESANQQLDDLQREYIKYKQHNQRTSFEIDWLEGRYGWENNKKLIHNAENFLNDLNENIKDISVSSLILLPKDINTAVERYKANAPVVLYYGCLIALQMYTLDKQANKLSTLKKVNKMNSKRQNNVHIKNQLTSTITNTEEATIFIEQNYHQWLSIYNKYKTNHAKHKDQYSTIPLHFRKWFKSCDSRSKNDASKKQHIQNYWSENSNTTKNSYIKNLLYYKKK
jgi:hypothetical protein